jgi:hypothetical protein
VWRWQEGFLGMQRSIQYTCYTCAFWLGQGVRERGPKGHCRRFPPAVTDRAPSGAFPLTNFTDWCGEWQRHKGEGQKKDAHHKEEPGRDERVRDAEATLYDDLPP